MTDASIVIDDKGEAWPEDAPEPRRRLGHSEFGSGWAAAVVREHGFVHVRITRDSAWIALRLGRFSLPALVGAIQAVYDLHPRRVIAHLLTDSGSTYEQFKSMPELVAYVESLASDWDPDTRVSRIMIPRDLRDLELPSFAAARELSLQWKRRGGKLSVELHRQLLIAAQRHSTILVRQPARSSRLIIEHFSSPIAFVRPCQALSLIGQDYQNLPDGDFGRWSARGYEEALASRTPGLWSMLADLHTPDGGIARSRYDRLLLPWRSADGDGWVLSLPLLRKRLMHSD
jgi:hypothetical protein